MGAKLLWTGLTIVVLSRVFGLPVAVAMAGAIVMLIGNILMLLDK